MTSESRLWVLVRTPEEDSDAERMFPTQDVGRKLGMKAIQIPKEVLSENFSEFVASIHEMLTNLPEDPSEYELEEITFNLSVDASGKVALIAEVSARSTSSVSIKWKRKNSAS